MNTLTEKQKRILDFLQEYNAKHGYTPTQTEIQRRFKFSSIATVQDYLKALESKNAIVRGNGKWNGIEVLSNKLPLLGKVAAGKPIEYVKHQETIEVPHDMLQGGGPYFALQVVGDSMIDEGILSDDLVIVRKREAAENGQIVIAMIDEEATIKRFYKRGSHIELKSGNAKYAPIMVKPHENFKIAGIYCGLIRYSN